MVEVEAELSAIRVVERRRDPQRRLHVGLGVEDALQVELRQHAVDQQLARRR